ncbi:MAG: DUF3604 domain-containing protein [Planctomycetes bacterium]|nr:DUF3604 domain-containing protein [Planctomycetota bacterium]
MQILRPSALFFVLASSLAADPRLLTGERTFDGQPAICRAADGTIWAAWVAYSHPEGDAVMTAACRNGEWSRAERVTPEPGQFLRPAICETGGRVWVFWTQSGDQLAAVWSASRDAEGWSRPRRLSTDGVAAQNPEAASDAAGRIAVAWQEMRGGQYDIALAVHAGGEWSRTRAFTADSSDDWDPSVAADSEGRFWIAWTSYRDDDYDVFLKCADGADSKERRLSARGEYDLHPWVAADESGGVWVAWDSLRLPHHADSGRSTITGANLEDDSEGDHGHGKLQTGIRLVCLEGGKLFELSGTAGALTPPEGYRLAHTALPKIAFAPDGTLWVAYRALGHAEGGKVKGKGKVKGPYWWEVFVVACGERGWGAAVKLPSSDGTLEEPAITAGAEGLWAAWQMEHRIEGAGPGWKKKVGKEEEDGDDHHADYGRVLGSNGDVYAALLEPEVRGESWLQLSKRPVRPDLNVAARVPREAARAGIEAGGEKYVLLWGDFHKHSNISRCSSGNEPGPDDHYKYAHDVCRYDFVAMTDHSEHTSNANWWRIQKLADLYNVPGSFSVLYGYEWSAKHPIGHHNVIFPDRPAPILRSNLEGARTTAELWASLDKAGVKALTIPHTTADPRMGTDWIENDDRFQRVCEIFQSCRGSYEYDGCPRQHSNATSKGGFYQDGLAKDYRMGIVCSSDHGWGVAYAVAWAKENTREAAFEAVWARRCYGSTAYGIVLDFRVDGHMMGSEVEASGPPEITVYARGTAPVRQIDIFGGGKCVHTVGGVKKPIGTKEARVVWRPESLAGGTTWYYARVIQADDEMAWASPVWVDSK